MLSVWQSGLETQQEYLGCEVLQHIEIGPESLFALLFNSGPVEQNVAEVLDHFEVVHMVQKPDQ